ncbi:unnamed protein product [Caenorhabditis angaria]|uniref:Inositol-pentakisphosphate 2-kinase n=1 Tax=Caenorhabditis angaria TaxID=860376 RepID=A0A9P1IDR9_9PELO|nr:unnamed protein product [Caenorhabditis angaria]
MNAKTAMSGGEKVLIDPRDFRSFCFRGEGRANFVISAKHRYNDSRIVWRFAKERKSGLMTVKARSEMVNDYMERIVSPFFDDKYLVNMSIVEFDTIDVHHLAKIPALPANQKIERFEELFDLPEEISFLPITAFQKTNGDSIITHPKRLSSLQMLDATQLPNSSVLDDFGCSTITIEIKPKQGFLQKHDNISIQNCNNCIMQFEKCGSAHFSEMYDFCPLDLFSSSFSRSKSAIFSLFLVPHRNLRIFRDGNLVHSDEKPLDEKMFDATLFPRNEAKTDDLITALSLIMSGSSSRKRFKLHKTSVLGQILQAQKIDEIGIVKAHEIYAKLDTASKSELLDKSALSRIGIESILGNCPPKKCTMRLEDFERMQKLRRYFVAATMKDCSVMVSMRLIPRNLEFNGENVLRLNNGRQFAYSIKIVDLDPKTPKNLINAYSRFMSGAKLIKLESETRHNQRGISECCE